MKESVHFVITGKVQGVGFRYYSRKQAIESGLNGWVRNLENGDVELLITGEQVGISAMQIWLSTGPRGSRIDSVKETAVPISTDDIQSELSEFKVLPNSRTLAY